MAAFDDSDDIKITTSLDTESAVKAAQDLKTAIEDSLKATETQFQKLQQISKSLSSALAEQSKAAGQAQVTNTKQVLDQTVAANATAADKAVKITEEAAAKRVRAEQRAQAQILEAQKVAVRAAEAENKRLEITQKEAHAKTLERIAELNLKRAIARKTPRAELPGELGGATASSKILKELEGLAVSVGNRFGFLTVNATQAYKILSSFGSLGKVFTGIGVAAGAAALGVGAITASAFRLSEASGKLEGLITGFQTLQQSVGRIPTESIEQLRAATQGLISDTQLYQKANQAVLLQVPTKLFEESAEAAVKLGRAMGIDAAFALESLSIGLGRQSRLYLDNLGIVVSAAEAYRNFAAENNKLVSELTEADKRLAFFNETSKKLKEALETLPPIQRTVGSEFAKIQASIENLNAEFLKGFNENNKLAAGYTDLNTEIGKLGIAFKNFGDVYASVVAAILNNPISKLVVGTAVGVVNEISANLAAKFGQGYEQVLARARQDLNAAEMDLAEFEKGRTSKLQQALGFDRERYQNRVDAARLTVDNIIAEQKRLEALPPVGIKTDTSALDNFESDFKSAIESIQEKVGEDLGVIKIRGVDPEQVSKTVQEIAKLGQQIEDKKVTAEQASTAIANYANSLAESARAIDLADVQSKIDKLDKTSKDYTKNLAQLTAEQKKLQTTLAPTPKTLDRINKAIEEGIKLGKKRAQDSRKNSKSALSDLKKEQKALENFTKSINRALENAIPDEVQKQLVDIFNDPQLDAQRLADEIQKLGQKFLAAGGDVQAFIKEAAKLKDIKDEFPDQPIINNAETTQGLANAKKGIVDIKKQLKGIGIEIGADGAFFGFDIGSFLTPEDEAAIANQVQGAIVSGLSNALDSAVAKDYEAAAKAIGETIGAVVGATIGGIIGSAFGPGGTALGASIGAAIGSVIGNLIGEAVFRLGGDGPGTKERKAVDKYFADLFEGGRVPILDVVKANFSDAIVDITSEAELGVRRISDLAISGANPAYFQTLSAEVQASFNGIGVAFASLLGVSREQAQQLAVALAANVGGSLQNLQVLIQQTGESVESLSEAVVKAFIDAQISIEEAYNSLLKIRGVMEQGLPGVVGDYTQAIQNFATALQDETENSGAYLIDAFRDIGVEAAEATGASFTSVVTQWGESIGLSGDKLQLFFALLARAGITTFEQLRNASEETIISILAGVNQIRDGIITSVEQINKFPIIPTIKPPSSPAPRASGPKGKSPEEERKERLKKLREETEKLLRESAKYAAILKQLTDGELTSAAAGEAIVAAQQEITELIKTRNRLEREYEDLLKKGTKANKQRLAEVAAALDANKKAIEEFANGAKKGESAFKKLDISAVIPLIKSANSLGVVSRAVGVDLEKVQDILLLAFRQGKITLEEYNKQLKETEDNLGAGIPNAVGAVSTAFQNLIDAGTKGGEFSIDAFSDIFAEFREKFENEGSAFRQQQRASLLQALEDAKKAAETAVGPDAAKQAQEALKAAQKALDDFYATIPAPSLADLRSELEKSFSGDQVNAFFQALDESGLNSFDQLASAGPEAVTKILARMQELGFSFGQTSEEIAGIIGGLNDASNAANGNKDPIQEALDLIKQFNEGANSLPPAFDKTNEAVNGLSGTLATLNAGFDDIIEKLSELSGLEFKNTVIFDVKTTGEAGAQKLVEILFGDGSTTTTGTGNGDTGTGGGGGGGGTTTSAPGPSLSRLKRKLRNLIRAGRGDSKEARDLRKRIAEMESK